MSAVPVGDWELLRELRRNGQKPNLPVIITTLRKIDRALDGIGALVVLHESGTPMPVNLLEGLDVIFWFDTCGMATKVFALCAERGITLGEFVRAWCSCGKHLTVAPISCESYADCQRWLDGAAA
jgi:hypothetical protein